MAVACMAALLPATIAWVNAGSPLGAGGFPRRGQFGLESGQFGIDLRGGHHPAQLGVDPVAGRRQVVERPRRQELVDGSGPGGWIFLYEPELHFGKQIVVPDMAAWTRKRMPSVPDVPYFELAPDWILGLFLGAGGLVGGYIGASLQSRVPEQALRRVLGLLALALGARYLIVGLS